VPNICGAPRFVPGANSACSPTCNLALTTDDATRLACKFASVPYLTSRMFCYVRA